MKSGSSAAASKRLEDKVAIITGGASGIGSATVQLFQENGAKVVIADIQDDLGRALADKLGENVCYIHCDVSNEDDIINLVDTTVTRFGKLDIMYSNAGIMDGSCKSVFDTTKSDFERVLAVNTVGCFLAAKHAARVMVQQRNGCILFTASVYTVIELLGNPSYGVSKYGVLGLVKSLASELGQYGVRVNCVSPYAVLTGMSSQAIVPAVDPAVYEAKSSELGNLRGQVLKAEDVAKAALYLASDDANYVSGLNLVVDGGYSIVNPTFMMGFADIMKQM